MKSICYVPRDFHNYGKLQHYSSRKISMAHELNQTTKLQYNNKMKPKKRKILVNK